MSNTDYPTDDRGGRIREARTTGADEDTYVVDDQGVAHDVTDRTVTERRDGAAYPVVDGDTELLQSPATQSQRLESEEVLARQQEAYGGMKFGSAFFGWLTAMGTAVLLTALAAGIGTAVGYTLPTNDDAADVITGNVTTTALIGGIIVLVLLFIAYFAGGYVAGRMARFSGAKQGLAVWLWALAIAIVLGIIGAVAGSQYDVLSNLNVFPRLPLDPNAITVASIVAAALALGVTLGGAVLGGVAGMRYHRAVDRAGLDS